MNALPNGIDSPTHDTDPSRHDSNSSHCSSNYSSSRDTTAHIPGNVGPWLTREDLTAIRKTNAMDIRCVSWILRNITGPEAIDAAIRLAGTVRWPEGGIDVEPPYDTTVPVFRAFFDPTGAVYPGLSDRAYKIRTGHPMDSYSCALGCAYPKSSHTAFLYRTPRTWYPVPPTSVSFWECTTSYGRLGSLLTQELSPTVIPLCTYNELHMRFCTSAR